MADELGLSAAGHCHLRRVFHSKDEIVHSPLAAPPAIVLVRLAVVFRAPNRGLRINQIDGEAFRRLSGLFLSWLPCAQPGSADRLVLDRVALRIRPGVGGGLESALRR